MKSFSEPSASELTMAEQHVLRAVVGDRWWRGRLLVWSLLLVAGIGVGTVLFAEMSSTNRWIRAASVLLPLAVAAFVEVKARRATRTALARLSSGVMR